MRYFFTSDSHFGHESKLQIYKMRGLDTCEEMNEKLIEDWNHVVGSTDLVYHLGDFSFGNLEFTKSILRRLNGTIVLIRGNHDQIIDKHAEEILDECLIADIYDYRKIKIDGRDIILSHYPFAVWDKCHYGSYHLYGHCHGKFENVGLSMDVGVDANPNRCLAPYSWEEIETLMDIRKCKEQQN